MRVTVVMPVHNAMPYLPLAITSILEQTFEDFMLQVIDDGSTDDSLEYLRSVIDPRLRIIQMDRRQGQGAARNVVLRTCKTEYVAFADADDISLPRRLEFQVAHLDSHPEVGMLGTKIAYTGPSGRRAGFSPPLALDHVGIRRDLLLGQHAVVNSTLIFRTCVFERTGVFRISGAGEDWDLFLRMTEATIVENLPGILLHVRLHSTSTHVRQARVLRLRYAHARECAEKRAASLAEADFEDFCHRQSQRYPGTRFLDDLAGISFNQYRSGIVDLVEGDTLRGYCRVVLAAVLAPHRLGQRASRTFRHLLLSRLLIFAGVTSWWQSVRVNR